MCRVCAAEKAAMQPTTIHGPDVRYYAITTQGRMRLNAPTLEAACEEIRKSSYLRGTARKLVREERQTYELEEMT